MNTTSISTDYILGVVTSRYIKKCLNENQPPDKILNNIKEIGLNNVDLTLTRLEKYIERYFSLKWDKNSKSWLTVEDNLNILIENDKEICEIVKNIKLSKTDYTLLIKDVKEILTEMKKVTRSLGTIISKVDIVASSIAILTNELDEEANSNENN